MSSGATNEPGTYPPKSSPFLNEVRQVLNTGHRPFRCNARWPTRTNQISEFGPEALCGGEGVLVEGKCAGLDIAGNDFAVILRFHPRTHLSLVDIIAAPPLRTARCIRMSGPESAVSSLSCVGGILIHANGRVQLRAERSGAPLASGPLQPLVRPHLHSRAKTSTAVRMAALTVP
jgi:hypothetical protein